MKGSKKGSKKAVKQQVAAKIDEKAIEKFNEDVQAFNLELTPLLAKYNLGLAAIPNFSLMDNGAFVVTAKVEAIRGSAKSELVKG